MAASGLDPLFEKSLTEYIAELSQVLEEKKSLATPADPLPDDINILYQELQTIKEKSQQEGLNPILIYLVMMRMKFIVRELGKNNDFLKPYITYFENMFTRYLKLSQSERNHLMGSRLNLQCGDQRPDPAKILVLVDIDNTLLLYDQKNNSSYNQRLIEALLRLQNNPDVGIWLFSNMSISDLTNEARYHRGLSTRPIITRPILMDYLRKAGVQILGVMTNQDYGYGKGPGAFYKEIYQPFHDGLHQQIKNIKCNGETFKKNYQSMYDVLRKVISRHCSSHDKFVACCNEEYRLALTQNSGSHFVFQMVPESDCKQGRLKLTTLKSYLDHYSIKPKKTLVFDDNIGCIKAVQYQCVIEKIPCEAHHFIGNYGAESVVARHMRDYALMNFDKRNHARMKSLIDRLNEFFKPQEAEIVAQLVAECQCGDVAAFFTLAKLATNEEHTILDKVSAYYLAMIAYQLAQKSKNKIALFIQKQFGLSVEGQRIVGECASHFPSIFPGYDAKALYQWVIVHIKEIVFSKQWLELKQWRLMQIQAQPESSEKKAGTDQERLRGKIRQWPKIDAIPALEGDSSDKYFILSEYYFFQDKYDTGAVPYMLAIIAYMHCDNLAAHEKIGRFIEDHFRDIILTHHLYEPWKVRETLSKTSNNGLLSGSEYNEILEVFTRSIGAMINPQASNHSSQTLVL